MEWSRTLGPIHPNGFGKGVFLEILKEDLNGFLFNFDIMHDVQGMGGLLRRQKVVRRKSVGDQVGDVKGQKSHLQRKHF